MVTTCTASSASGPPHLVWTVNDPWAVDDTSNYDFAETDAILANVASFGAGVYLRLGDSFNGVNDTGDPKSYARVATNIYRHVIGEFGSAAAATQPLHVEVYNEPDGMFWVGTDEDFYELFRETVDGVREAASAAGVDVSVGGAGFVHGVTKGLATEGSLADGFVEAVGPERLDFFSAHYYGDCAAEELSDVVTWMTTLRGQLDERGLADTPLHITEWNIGLGTACGMDYYSASRLQSFVGAALVLMHDPSLQIEAAQYYAGIPTMGLFGTSDGRFIVRPGAWALAAHSQLVGHPRLPAEVCDDGACVASGLDQAESPLLALAARTGDGLRAVVVNDTDAPRPYVLHVAGDGVEAATIETVTPPNEARELDAVTEGGVEVPSPTELEALLAEGATPAEAADVVVGVGTAQVSLTVPAHSVQTVVVTRP